MLKTHKNVLILKIFLLQIALIGCFKKHFLLIVNSTATAIPIKLPYRNSANIIKRSCFL